ncbi:MAG: hypothetical protein KC466_02065, partial [Myxococcales bacterium]|nr:hypothetical protein [Myxococcales bacterium]
MTKRSTRSANARGRLRRFFLTCRWTLLWALVATGSYATAAWSEGPRPLTERLRERLRVRLEATDPARFEARGDRLHATAALASFYERRGYAPAWVGDGGPLALLGELITALDGAEREGLRPDDYHRRALAAV